MHTKFWVGNVKHRNQLSRPTSIRKEYENGYWRNILWKCEMNRNGSASGPVVGFMWIQYWTLWFKKRNLLLICITAQGKSVNLRYLVSDIQKVCSLTGHDGMQSGRWLPTFQGKLLQSLSQRQKHYVLLEFSYSPKHTNIVS